MQKVIAYLRVSSEIQDEDRQRALIKDYCLKNGYEYAREIKEKISGAKTDRAGLNELRALTNEDGDVVVVSETSRLSRDDDYLKLLNIVNELLEADLDVFFLDGEKKYKKGTKLTLYDIIQLAFEAKANAEERKKIAARLLSGRITKLAHGAFAGHQVAFGYQVVPNPLKEKNDSKHGKSLYKVDPNKIETVKLIFDLIGNKGYTIRETARYLIKIGEVRDGKRNWTSNTIYSIIHNPLYKGDFTFMGNIGNVDGIIDEESFNKAQTQLKQNHLLKNKGTKNFYIFKGIAKCACGSSLVQCKTPKNEFTLRCLKRRSGFSLEECSNYGLNRELLNNIIWTTIKSYLGKDDFSNSKNEQLVLITKNISGKIKQIEVKREYLDRIEKKMNNLVDSLSESGSKAIYQRINIKLNELEQEEIEIKGVIKELAIELAELKKSESILLNNFDIKTIDSLNEAEKRNIYLNYIDKIVYYSISPYYGYIVIYYKHWGREIKFIQVNHTGRKAFHIILDNGKQRWATEVFDNLVDRLKSDERITDPLSIISYSEASFKDYCKNDDMKSKLIPL